MRYINSVLPYIIHIYIYILYSSTKIYMCCLINSFSLFISAEKFRIPSASFSVAIASSLSIHLNFFSFISNFCIFSFAANCTDSRVDTSLSFNLFNSSNNLGDIVSLSHPAKCRISSETTEQQKVLLCSIYILLYEGHNINIHIAYI